VTNVLESQTNYVHSNNVRSPVYAGKRAKNGTNLVIILQLQNSQCITKNKKVSKQYYWKQANIYLIDENTLPKLQKTHFCALSCQHWTQVAKCTFYAATCYGFNAAD